MSWELMSYGELMSGGTNVLDSTWYVRPNNEPVKMSSWHITFYMGPGTENLFFLAASLNAKVDNVPASKPQPLARMMTVMWLAAGCWCEEIGMHRGNHISDFGFQTTLKFVNIYQFIIWRWRLGSSCDDCTASSLSPVERLRSISKLSLSDYLVWQ